MPQTARAHVVELIDVLSSGCEWRKWFPPPAPTKATPMQVATAERFKPELQITEREAAVLDFLLETEWQEVRDIAKGLNMSMTMAYNMVAQLRNKAMIRSRPNYRTESSVGFQVTPKGKQAAASPQKWAVTRT